MSQYFRLIPWVATASLVASSSAMALTADNFHPLGAQINQLQYTHDTDTQTAPQQKSAWQKPNVHGRGNNTLHLAAAKGTKAWPGEMFKGKDNKKFPGGMWKTKNDNKKFPGVMWKPKGGNKQFPGEMWKGKNRPANRPASR
ncbi:MAG: hypothetical protein P1U40_01395 [Coxiellaceae bacterium]|nr:hypothetical protein [Coxiellaceae bacterium]